MIQLLAFDPTHRLSADAALKFISLRSTVQPQLCNLPPTRVVPPHACSGTADSEKGDGSDGDFWRLENILQVYANIVPIPHNMTFFQQCCKSRSSKLSENMKAFMRHTSSHVRQGGSAPLHILLD
jgi:hypothetical protein